MTFHEFVRKYNGKKVETNYNGRPDTYYQCVDLVNQYIKEVHGLGPIAGNGISFDVNSDPNKWTYFRNTWSFVPKNGDIAVFGRLIGPYGHVDIVYVDPWNPCNTKTFSSFSQNWPKGSPSHIIKHWMYFGVKGFLRKK